MSLLDNAMSCRLEGMGAPVPLLRRVGSIIFATAVAATSALGAAPAAKAGGSFTLSGAAGPMIVTGTSGSDSYVLYRDLASCCTGDPTRPFYFASPTRIAHTTATCTKGQPDPDPDFSTAWFCPIPEVVTIAAGAGHNSFAWGNCCGTPVDGNGEAITPDTTFTSLGGNDSYGGGAAIDTLDTGGGNDSGNLSGGPDDLTAGPGEDTFSGGRGDDTLRGGADNDVLNGDLGADTIDGDAGNDTLTGGPGGDLALIGGDGNDSIDGGEGDDRVVSGGAGSDTINGGEGEDVIDGGDGADPVLAGGIGNDTISAGAGDDSLDGGAGNDTLGGQAGDDTLTDTGGANTLFGGEGHDTFTPGVGVDDVSGGASVDAADYSGRAGAPVVSVSLDDLANDGDPTLPNTPAGEGDNIRTDVENVIGGAGNDTITGSAEFNSLVGGAGEDRLDGLGGVDVIDGGSGDDYMVSRDGIQDVVLCGDGDDKVVADQFDSVYDCETVSASRELQPDADADGSNAPKHGGGDCDDRDAARFPGATEVPGDGIDQDCDGKDGSSPVPPANSPTLPATRSGQLTNSVDLGFTFDRSGRARLKSLTVINGVPGMVVEVRCVPKRARKRVKTPPCAFNGVKRATIGAVSSDKASVPRAIRGTGRFADGVGVEVRLLLAGFTGKSDTFVWNRRKQAFRLTRRGR